MTVEHVMAPVHVLSIMQVLHVVGFLLHTRASWPILDEHFVEDHLEDASLVQLELPETAIFACRQVRLGPGEARVRAAAASGTRRSRRASFLWTVSCCAE
jgi:hypothetical protein